MCSSCRARGICAIEVARYELLALCSSRCIEVPDLVVAGHMYAEVDKLRGPCIRTSLYVLDLVVAEYVFVEVVGPEVCGCISRWVAEISVSVGDLCPIHSPLLAVEAKL